IAIYAGSTAKAMEIANSFSFLDRIFLASYSIIFYILKMFFPFNLSGFYPFPTKIDNTLPIEYYLSLIPILLIVFGIYKAPKFRKELIFGMLFFLITISLVLQLL